MKIRKTILPPDQPSSGTLKIPKSSLAWASDLSSLPSSAGVYWFLDAHNLVLYVGKAKNIKKRVQSYTRFPQLANRTRQLVKVAVKVKFKELPSELEALLTEAELIRRYQPQYNVLLKDDKSPLYILITNEL